MNWTTLEDLKNQLNKLWDKGILLDELAGGVTRFPWRMVVKGPTDNELGEHFEDVGKWIRQLSGAADLYRIEWRSTKRGPVGRQTIPRYLLVEQLSDALELIGKRREAKKYAAILDETRVKLPALLPWVIAKPLSALKLANDWGQLLSILGWFLEHPRPSIYLRQIDVPGVDTKWIERHLSVLGKVLDEVLPEDFVDRNYTANRAFCRRYGFLDKPLRVRFRLLDSSVRLLPGEVEQDITVTQIAFASLDLPVSRVFIIENEINFLAFPPLQDAMVIFGAGYCFDNVGMAPWLHERAIYYWGDIDTHGFGILDQLRGHFPHVVSFLMDHQTLHAHKTSWVVEDKPTTRALERLNNEEALLYDHLRKDKWGKNVRLEQELIGYDFMLEVLNSLY